MPQSLCPCDSGRCFAECCAPYLDDQKPAPTAEALMRSRYTAYTRGDADYLLRTWYAGTRPATLKLEDDGTRWLGLQIRATRAGQVGDTEGEVEFVARFKQGGRAHRLHETSRFVREDDRWYYLDGSLHETPAGRVKPRR